MRSFEINDATDVTLTSDGSMAFVQAFNRFQQETDTRDPNLNVNNPAGGNVAIALNPMDKGATFIAATRAIPIDFGLGVAVSGDDRYLYVSSSGNHHIRVYDIFEINKVLERVRDPAKAFEIGGRRYLQTARRGVDDISLLGDDLLFFHLNQSILGTSRVGYNKNIDIRANFVAGGFNLDVGPIGDPPTNLPLASGGTPRDMASQDTFLKLLGPKTATGDATPVFEWSLSGQRFQSTIYVSVAGPGTGLFPSDTDASGIVDLMTEGFFGVSAGSLDDKAVALARLNLLDDNRNRIWAKRIAAPDGAENLTFELPSWLQLTAGQTYWWGVEVVKDDGTKVRKAASFKVEAPVAAAGLFSSVTVITHGQNLPAMGPDPTANHLFELAKDIAKTNGGTIAKYDPVSGQFTSIVTGSGPITANGKALVLIADWSTGAAINDTGFAEAAGEALFAALLRLDRELSGALFRSNMHVIGQDRGAVVNSEMLQRMTSMLNAPGGPARAGMPSLPPDLHVTTLNPSDGDKVMNLPVAETIKFIGEVAKGLSIAAVLVNPAVAAKLYDFADKTEKVANFFTLIGYGQIDYGDLKDPDVKIWKGITFADNYYTTVADATKLTFTMNGRSLADDGADIDRNLTGRAGFIEDDLYGAEYLGTRYGLGLNTVGNRLVAWYGGTADLQRLSFGADPDKSERIWRQLADRTYETPNGAEIFSSTSLSIAMRVSRYDPSPRMGSSLSAGISALKMSKPRPRLSRTPSRATARSSRRPLRAASCLRWPSRRKASAKASTIQHRVAASAAVPRSTRTSASTPSAATATTPRCSRVAAPSRSSSTAPSSRPCARSTAASPSSSRATRSPAGHWTAAAAAASRDGLSGRTISTAPSPASSARISRSPTRSRRFRKSRICRPASRRCLLPWTG